LKRIIGDDDEMDDEQRQRAYQTAVAYLELATALEEDGKFREALEEAETAWKYCPDDSYLRSSINATILRLRRQP